MGGPKFRHINSHRGTIQNLPIPADHDAVGPVRATQDESGQRISCTGKSQVIECEKRKISLLSDGDFSYVVAPEAAR